MSLQFPSRCLGTALHDTKVLRNRVKVAQLEAAEALAALEGLGSPGFLDKFLEDIALVGLIGPVIIASSRSHSLDNTLFHLELQPCEEIRIGVVVV